MAVPGHDRHVVLGRRAAEQDDDRRRGSVIARRLPAGPVADELDLELELDAVPRATSARTRSRQAADVGRACPSGR